MSDRKPFAVLLYQLSQRLNKEETDGIIHIEDLPQNLEEKGALKVLIHLQMQGIITNEDPSTLQSVMNNLNRMDLVAKVKEFIKSQKKNKRAIKPKRCNKTMESDLDANLKVSLLQIKVLMEQLTNLVNLASRYGKTSMVQRIQEAMSLSETVETNITCAQQELDSKDSSSSLESSTSGGEEDFPKSPPAVAEDLEVPYPTQEENKQDDDANDDEGLYETVTNTPRIPFTVASVSPPDVEYSYATPDAGPPRCPMNSTPFNSVTDIKTRLTKLKVPDVNIHAQKQPKNIRKPMPPPKPVPSPKPTTKVIIQQKEEELDSSIDDCSYTGSTGDSGFVDSWKFRKKPVLPSRHQSSKVDQGGTVKLRPTPAPKPPPKPNSYAKLNVEGVETSYYTSIQDRHQRFQGNGTESHDVQESLYQNWK